MKEEKDSRPVKCFICNKKMYYCDHKKHEPEVRISDDKNQSYAHFRCVKKQAIPIKFTDFQTSNESGRFLVNPFWLEHLLNLFYQGYVGEVWIEVQDTLMNHTETIKNLSYGVIGKEFNKIHLGEEMLK